MFVLSSKSKCFFIVLSCMLKTALNSVFAKSTFHQVSWKISFTITIGSESASLLRLRCSDDTSMKLILTTFLFRSVYSLNNRSHILPLWKYMSYTDGKRWNRPATARRLLSTASYRAMPSAHPLMKLWLLCILPLQSSEPYWETQC